MKYQLVAEIGAGLAWPFAQTCHKTKKRRGCFYAWSKADRMSKLMSKFRSHSAETGEDWNRPKNGHLWVGDWSKFPADGARRYKVCVGSLFSLFSSLNHVWKGEKYTRERSFKTEMISVADPKRLKVTKRTLKREAEAWDQLCLPRYIIYTSQCLKTGGDDCHLWKRSRECSTRRIRKNAPQVARIRL